MAAHEASLLHAVVVVPVAVGVQLATVFRSKLSRLEGIVRFTRSPVQEGQRRPVCPAPADWQQKQILERGLWMVAIQYQHEQPTFHLR